MADALCVGHRNRNGPRHPARESAGLSTNPITEDLQSMSSVTSEKRNATPETPDLVFWEPVVDLYAIANSLEFLTDKFNAADAYGEANIVGLLGKQVKAIAEHMDDNWQEKGAAQ